MIPLWLNFHQNQSQKKRRRIKYVSWFLLWVLIARTWGVFGKAGWWYQWAMLSQIWTDPLNTYFPRHEISLAILWPQSLLSPKQPHVLKQWLRWCLRIFNKGSCKHAVTLLLHTFLSPVPGKRDSLWLLQTILDSLLDFSTVKASTTSIGPLILRITTSLWDCFSTADISANAILLFATSKFGSSRVRSS